MEDLDNRAIIDYNSDNNQSIEQLYKLIDVKFEENHDLKSLFSEIIDIFDGTGLK